MRNNGGPLRDGTLREGESSRVPYLKPSLENWLTKCSNLEEA